MGTGVVCSAGGEVGEMKFSIITPTIQRDSLRRCCASVDRQSYSEWEHIVMVDDNVLDRNLLSSLRHQNRSFGMSMKRHANFGNTPRHNAWRRATGDWVIYLDDDNYLADDHVLGDLAVTLSTVPYWAVFPIRRHDHLFFNDPPGNCAVDTANMVIRREIAQWPEGTDYTMDGLFCEELRAKYPYTAFPQMRPIIVVEASNHGE